MTNISPDYGRQLNDLTTIMHNASPEANTRLLNDLFISAYEQEKARGHKWEDCLTAATGICEAICVTRKSPDEPTREDHLIHPLEHQAV